MKLFLEVAASTVKELNVTKICKLFDGYHSDQCEVIHHCPFICISLIISNDEHLFMHLWPFLNDPAEGLHLWPD